MFRKITQIFLKGLITLLPIGVTFYLLYNGIILLENMLGSTLKIILGTSYIPGLGLLSTLALIFLFGILITNFITQSIWKQIEKKLTQVPLIKALYSPLKDLMGLFSTDGQKELKSVVLVQLNPGQHVVGLVTRDQFQDITPFLNNDSQLVFQNKVAVYIPLSYALGGFTALVDKDTVTKLDIPVEKALSLAITGWVKSNSEENSNE